MYLVEDADDFAYLQFGLAVLVDLVEDADDFTYLQFGLALLVDLVEDADDFTYLQFGLALLVDLVEDADEVEEDLGRRGVLLHGEVSLHVAVERVQQEHVAYGPPLLLLLLVSTDFIYFKFMFLAIQ